MSDERDRLARVYAGYRRRRAKRWGTDNPGNRAILDEVAGHVLPLVLETSGPILDVGCGSGWWLERLRRAGISPRRLHGVDLLEARAAAARRRVPGSAVRVADARRLPYGDGEFGLVTLFLVLSSMPDEGAMRMAVAEAARVVRPGGPVVLWDLRTASTNPQVRSVPWSALEREFPPATDVPVTVAPPLARRLGMATSAVYPRLARVRPLTTHRLRVHVRPARR